MPYLKPRVNHLLVVVDGEVRGELFKVNRTWRRFSYGEDDRERFPLGTTLMTIREVLARVFEGQEVVLREPGHVER